MRLTLTRTVNDQCSGVTALSDGDSGWISLDEFIPLIRGLTPLSESMEAEARQEDRKWAGGGAEQHVVVRQEARKWMQKRCLQQRQMVRWWYRLQRREMEDYRRAVMGCAAIMTARDNDNDCMVLIMNGWC